MELGTSSKEDDERGHQKIDLEDGLPAAHFCFFWNSYFEVLKNPKQNSTCWQWRILQPCKISTQNSLYSSLKRQILTNLKVFKFCTFHYDLEIWHFYTTWNT
jgi:hypothetical protein